MHVSRPLATTAIALTIAVVMAFYLLGIRRGINATQLAEMTGAALKPIGMILLVVGALIMAFGAGWQRIRGLIIRPTLPTSLLDKLPPIRVHTT